MTTAISAGAFFLAVVVIALVGDEAFHSDYIPLDELTRAAVGLLAALIIAGLGVAGFALGARRTAFARQLEREAEREPHRVGTWLDRRDIEAESPFGNFFVFLWFFIGIAALGLLIMVLALVETMRYNPESAAEGWAIFGVLGGAAVIVGLAGAVARGVLVPRFRDAAGMVVVHWRSQERALATRAERDAQNGASTVDFGAGRRIAERVVHWAVRIAPPLAGVGFVIFMAGVWLRQPCRNCDERYWDEPVEDLIDGLVTIGGPLLIAAALVGLVSVAATWVALVIERATILRLLEDGGRSPRPAQLLPHLTQPGPLPLLGIALVAAGVPPAVVLAIGPGGDPTRSAIAGILGLLAVIGVALIWLGEGVDGRFRNRIREAWPPGDPVPPKPDARRGTARARDAGDLDGDGITD